MTHLQALHDAVKAGDKRGIIENADAIETRHWMSFFHAATGDNSQAAIDFVQAALPGWVIGNMGQATVGDDGHFTTTPKWHCWIVAPDYLETCEQVHSVGDGPACALLLAALAAMIANGEGK